MEAVIREAFFRGVVHGLTVATNAELQQWYECNGTERELQKMLDRWEAMQVVQRGQDLEEHGDTLGE